FKVFRIKIAFDHRPVGGGKSVTVNFNQPLPNVMPFRLGLNIEGIAHRVIQSVFTSTHFSPLRSIRIGFRKARPKLSNETVITSPSCSASRSLKLNTSAPRK